MLQLIDGSLVSEQVPMVELDGKKLLQTRVILSYIATKGALHGKDMRIEVCMICVVWEILIS